MAYIYIQLCYGDFAIAARPGRSARGLAAGPEHKRRTQQSPIALSVIAVCNACAWQALARPAIMDCTLGDCWRSDHGLHSQ